MRKVPFDLFRKLKVSFDGINAAEGFNYVIVPYFISAHPGCTEKDMQELADEVRIMGVKPEQVQDFTPTPMTLSTTMYYTGLDPYSGEKLYVAKGNEAKGRQKDLFFWYTKDRNNKGRSVSGKLGKVRSTGVNSRKKIFRDEGFRRDGLKRRGRSN
jgi:radical SAM superfamily enzyme YgiQ (UPF0313 family)